MVEDEIKQLKKLNTSFGIAVCIFYDLKHTLSFFILNFRIFDAFEPVPCAASSSIRVTMEIVPR